MASEVTCPNCARPMRLVRALPTLSDQLPINVFECRSCKVTFTTEDHMPVGGALRSR